MSDPTPDPGLEWIGVAQVAAEMNLSDRAPYRGSFTPAPIAASPPPAPTPRRDRTAADLAADKLARLRGRA